MQITLLKSKIHQARVTDADLNYEGSIGIDKEILNKANICVFEKVDVYNITTGARFSTYAIEGKSGEISLNGAAARLVQKDDTVIIASYANYSEEEVKYHKPTIILLDRTNQIKEII
jgi:aspartate 1-decarboxylase